MFLNRQRIYILGNWPYLFLIKIGIAGNVQLRKKDINKSTKGRPFVILNLSVPYARRVEKMLHSLCSPLNIQWSGSGKTEWFFVLALVFALPIVLLTAVLEVLVLGLGAYVAYRFLLC